MGSLISTPAFVGTEGAAQPSSSSFFPPRVLFAASAGEERVRGGEKDMGEREGVDGIRCDKERGSFACFIACVCAQVRLLFHLGHSRKR